VLHAIVVPTPWLEQGVSIEVQLPRLLPCARCVGGGCDLCERKGAFEQAASGASSEVVVTLPQLLGGASGPVCLRLPACGARHATDPDLPLGHLLLTVVPREPADGWQPASSVRKLETSHSTQSSARAAGIWAALLLLVSLLSWWCLT
jgi:hypothetical protein